MHARALDYPIHPLPLALSKNFPTSTVKILADGSLGLPVSLETRTMVEKSNGKWVIGRDRSAEGRPEGSGRNGLCERTD